MAFLALGLGACDSVFSDAADPTTGMTRDDARQLRNRDLIAQSPDAPPIPDMQMPTIPPKTPMMGQDRLVTVTVVDNVPLRDVLMQLAREAKMNVEIDPRIQGGIIFSAHDQPFTTVLERISSLAGLRYRIDGDFLRVELDDPYMKTYQLDYPTLSRRTESEVAIATNVFDADVTTTSSNGTTTTSGGSGRADSDNNSVSRLKAVSETDFWNEVQKNLTNIMASIAEARPLVRTDKTENRKSTEPGFSINRQAGVVSIFGTEMQQRAVAEYLDKLKSNASAQVLIEARIVEVELNEEYRSGINWRTLFDNSMDVAARFGPAAVGAPFVTAATATDGVFTASFQDGDIASILNLVRTFGTTRILSSPRLTVLNNQTAVLKVARNEVYFTTSAQFPTTVSTGGVPISGTPVFTSTPRTVPVGLVMTVQPSINQDSQDITMTLRPTISRIVDRVKDPSIGLNAAQIGIASPTQSLIPVLAVREMDSILRMRSGEVAIMGGLMQDSSENTEDGVPGADEIPFFGNLAKAKDQAGKVTELVILLRATVMKQAAPHAADIALYQTYSRDPRPLPLPRAQPPLAPENLQKIMMNPDAAENPLIQWEEPIAITPAAP